MKDGGEGGGTRQPAAWGRHCPPSAAAAVPEQRGDAPGHPTPQSRHPAADRRRTHAPEVTQHSKLKRERGGALGAQGFMVTPPLEDAIAIGQTGWGGRLDRKRL